VLDILGMERCIVGSLPFWQQIVEKIFKFEILTLRLGFFNFEFWASNDYRK
jgi:hypothetical protein